MLNELTAMTRVRHAFAVRRVKRTQPRRIEVRATATRHVVGPHDGEQVRLLALGVRFLIDGESTGGRFSLVEHPLGPRRLGAPIHTHTNEDEYSYVLKGRAGVQIGEEVFEAGPGALILKPRGIPHTF